MAKKTTPFTTSTLRKSMIEDLKLLRAGGITLSEATTRSDLANGILTSVSLETSGAPRKEVTLG